MPVWSCPRPLRECDIFMHLEHQSAAHAIQGRRAMKTQADEEERSVWDTRYEERSQWKYLNVEPHNFVVVRCQACTAPNRCRWIRQGRACAARNINRDSRSTFPFLRFFVP